MNNTENNNTQVRDGLVPKIWGPHTWIFLHSITFDYPEKPTQEDKENYKKYFELIGAVLPCYHCRESYKKYIQTGTTELNDDVMKDRESITKWLYYVHEAVNNKLNVDYGVSYNDVVQRYESYRGSCIHDKKQDAYKKQDTEEVIPNTCEINANKKQTLYKINDCPIIPNKLSKHFVKYARMRGLTGNDFYIVNDLDKNIKKDNNLWNRRNIECREIIDKMRSQEISSLESQGKWKDLPTIDELKLILRLSSNLSREKLIETIKKLPQCECEFKKIYKLTS